MVNNHMRIELSSTIPATNLDMPSHAGVKLRKTPTTNHELKNGVVTFTQLQRSDDPNITETINDPASSNNFPSNINKDLHTEQKSNTDLSKTPAPPSSNAQDLVHHIGQDVYQTIQAPGGQQEFIP